MTHLQNDGIEVGRTGVSRLNLRVDRRTRSNRKSNKESSEVCHRSGLSVRSYSGDAEESEMHASVQVTIGVESRRAIRLARFPSSRTAAILPLSCDRRHTRRSMQNRHDLIVPEQAE